MGKINVKAFGTSGKDGTKTITYKGIDVQVRQCLSYPEMRAFVDIVSRECFDNNGDYLPELKDYITRCLILKMYTNIDIPEDDYECYGFVYDNEELILAITSSFDNLQLGIIEEAIDNKIAYTIRTNADKINKRLDGIASSIDDLISSLTSIFDGIDNDDIKNLTSALKESGFDEDRFIETYMKQLYRSE